MTFSLVFDCDTLKRLHVETSGSTAVDFELCGGSWIVGAMGFRNGITGNDFLRLLGSKQHNAEDLYGYLTSAAYQYSVVYYDEVKKKLYVFKDFSGCEPCYYSFSGSRLVISGSLSQVVSIIGFPVLDAAAAFQFVYFEMPRKPLTLYKGVYSFLNECTYTLDEIGQVFHVEDMFRFPKEDDSSTDLAGLRNCIARSHADRIGSSNGIYLSGGIDSQVMAISLKQDIGLDNVIAYNFSVKGAGQTEV